MSLSTDEGNDDYDEDFEGDDNAENDIVCVTIVSEVWVASCHHSVTNKQYALGQQ